MIFYDRIDFVLLDRDVEKSGKKGIQGTPATILYQVFQQVFDLQDRAIASVHESAEQQAALETAPKMIDPIQQTLSTIIQKHLSHPDVDRTEALELIRFLNQPMMKAQTKRLKKVYAEFESSDAVKSLIEEIAKLREEFGPSEVSESARDRLQTLARDDLRLICFDFVSG